MMISFAMFRTAEIVSVLLLVQFDGLMRSHLHSTVTFLMDIAQKKDVLRELSSHSVKLQSPCATVVTTIDDTANTTRLGSHAG